MGNKAKQAAGYPSKPVSSKAAGKSPRGCGWFTPIALELRRQFPRNTAAEIAFRANRHISVVEKWLAGKGAPDGAALLNLQNSDVGEVVILAGTRDCNHAWRAELEQGRAYIIAKKKLKAAQRELAQAEALEI